MGRVGGPEPAVAVSDPAKSGESGESPRSVRVRVWVMENPSVGWQDSRSRRRNGLAALGRTVFEGYKLRAVEGGCGDSVAGVDWIGVS